MSSWPVATNSHAMAQSLISGEWECDKRHGQGVCLFADGTCFRGEWEEDAWLQSAADPALSKVVGLTDGLAGQRTSFSIQVQPCCMCSLYRVSVQPAESIQPLQSIQPCSLHMLYSLLLLWGRQH